MQYNKEQIEKARKCKTIDEFRQAARTEGLLLTEEQIKAYFEATRSGKLSDDDLDTVAGGKGKPDPLYAVGSEVYFMSNGVCGKGTIKSVSWDGNTYMYTIIYSDEGGKITFTRKENDIWAANH